MARKPAHLMAVGGKPQGRQGIWEAIRARRDSLFTLGQLAAATDIPRATIRTYLRGLEAAGYISRFPCLHDRVPRIGVTARWPS